MGEGQKVVLPTVLAMPKVLEEVAKTPPAGEFHLAAPIVSYFHPPFISVFAFLAFHSFSVECFPVDSTT